MTPQLAIVDGKILIVGGVSRRGWSRLSTFLTCEYKFVRRYHTPGAGRGYEGKAVKFGTTGHTGMAHQLARWGAGQGGVNISGEIVSDRKLIMPRQDAMRIEGAKNGLSKDEIDTIIAAVDDYFRVNVDPPGRIIAVEREMTAVVGKKGNAFGLWVVDDEGNAADGQPVTAWKMKNLPTVKEGSILNEVYGMDVGERHPDEGRPVEITRRFDAEIAVGSGPDDPVDIWDHKFSVMPFNDKKRTAYQMDGQFALVRVFGQQFYGDRFQAAKLNCIHRVSPYTHGKVDLPAVRHDSKTAFNVWTREHQISNAMASWGRDFWPVRNLETNCKHTYGVCDFYSHCMGYADEAEGEDY